MSNSSEESGGWIPADQVQQMIADALAQHQSAAGAPGTASSDQVQAMIDQALARQAAGYQEQLNQMAASLRGQVVTFIPEHGGGPGTEIAPTWSQWEQTKAQEAADAKAAGAASAVHETVTSHGMFPPVHA